MRIATSKYLLAEVGVFDTERTFVPARYAFLIIFLLLLPCCRDDSRAA